ncbi:class I SAM-dependent methyltransferase [Oceanobacillus damuensis]|uniref:class I SAM-dependent methyltransferase n=1 Tax=Oceanobacillus damuensis TaxID=937928 RepID=UPI0008302C74|nr:class I SAM-dependent methyltransferase [Oceanobacillus damuensis]
MSNNSKKTLKEIHDYWINRSLPGLYIDKAGRSEFLINYVKKYIEQNGKILEIGCNAGRNLNYLYKNNFYNLTGIEISEEAIRALNKTYPLLAQNAKIIHSPVENIIKELPSRGFDLVFTMAVLEHIHPDSDWIFEDIARITGSYLITIEAETAKHWRIFPRNYKKIFKKFGLKQVEEHHCDTKSGLRGYTLRVFKK